MKKIAVYAGSFDPFHNGHLDIVKKASKIFDIVYVLIADNSTKQRKYDTIKMSRVIQTTLIEQQLTNCFCIVGGETEYTVDIAESLSAKYLIRGVRNEEDFKAEEWLAETNLELNPNIETIYLRANKPDISSTLVKKTLFTKDFVPPSVYNFISKEN